MQLSINCLKNSVDPDGWLDVHCFQGKPKCDFRKEIVFEISIWHTILSTRASMFTEFVNIYADSRNRNNSLYTQLPMSCCISNKKGIMNAATWSQIFCLQTPTHPHPLPTQGMGAIGQKSTFAEHSHVAYQIKGNHEMQQHGSKGPLTL